MNGTAGPEGTYGEGAPDVQKPSRSGRRLTQCASAQGTWPAARSRGGDVRAEAGCTVVAAVREEDVITPLDPKAFVFRDDDQVVVVGTAEGVRRVEERYLR